MSALAPWLDDYPPGIPTTYDIPRVPLTRLVDDAARDYPDAEAICGADWVTASARIDRAAAALAGLGVTMGDDVLVVFDETTVGLGAVLAVTRLGAVANVCANSEDEVGSILEHASPDLAIVCGGVSRSARKAAERHGCRIVDAGDGTWIRGERRRPARLLSKRSLDALVAAAPMLRPVPTVDPGATAVRLRSSHRRATAGQTAWVSLSHAEVVAAAFQSRLWFADLRAGHERVLVAAPATTSWGLCAGALMGVLAAAAIELKPSIGSALAENIAGWRPTVLVLEHAQAVSLVRRPDVDHDLTSIRVASARGLGLSEPDMASFEQLTVGGRIRNVWGNADVGPVTFATPHYGRAPAGATGYPTTDVQVRIDGSADRPDAGDVHVRTPVTRIRHGAKTWVATGHRGRITDDGIVVLDD